MSDSWGGTRGWGIGARGWGLGNRGGGGSGCGTRGWGLGNRGGGGSDLKCSDARNIGSVLALVKSGVVCAADKNIPTSV